MSALFAPLPTELATFLLLLARVGGVIVVAPLLGDQHIPSMVKAALSAVLAFVLMQARVVMLVPLPANGVLFALVVGEQVVLGLALGFVSLLVFNGIEMAGSIVATQMGLSMANVVNPMTQAPSTVLSQLYNVLAVLIFLAVNGPEWILLALERSLQLIPLQAGLSLFSGNTLFQSAVTIVSNALLIALQLSVPAMGALLLSDLVLGLLSRMVSNFNAYAVGMPLKILVGLGIFMVSLPQMIVFVTQVFQGSTGEILTIWKAAS